MSVEAQKAKQVIIDEIKEKLDGAQSAVVIDYMGITVAQADAMRKKLREANVDYTVYKNTLVKRAIAGTEFEGLAEVLDGPSALAISKDDATAPARVLNEVIKDFKKMDIGDIVGIKGFVFTTKMGEISVHAHSVTLLSKSLQILPEKYRGYSVQRCSACKIPGQHPVPGQQGSQNIPGYRGRESRITRQAA